MHDLVIEDARIVDGTGGPSRHGSVAVKDGRIVEVGDASGQAARERLNAGGRVVAPGFIRIDRRFRDRAPHVVRDPKRGDLFVIDGLDKPIPMGLIAGAGKRAEDLTVFGTRFEDMHRGGWDPEARLADQDRDGVAAEILYPTVGMMLCNHLVLHDNVAELYQLES